MGVRFRPIADICSPCHLQVMLRASALIFVALAGSALSTTTASACSVFVSREPSPRESQNDARRLIREATAVVDGEVVRASNGRPALVYAYRVLKGPQKQWFEVGERTTCDVALTQVGERLRLILVGGPDTYFLPVDYSNARAEDRVLKSDRRKEWPIRRSLAQGKER